MLPEGGVKNICCQRCPQARCVFTTTRGETTSASLPSSFNVQLTCRTGCRCPLLSRLKSTVTRSASGLLGVYW